MSFEVPRADVLRISAAAEAHGALVREIHEEPEGGRFIGTIDGRTITLFPKYDSNFAMVFTVAHLFGHLAQLVRPLDARTKAAIELVYAKPRVFTHDEVQCLYDYEWEAALIGRTLLGEAFTMTPELEGEYARMFLADFHYLVGFLETGEGGPAVFDRYLRRQPRPHLPIPPDPRALPDVSRLQETAEIRPDAVVV